MENTESNWSRKHTIGVALLGSLGVLTSLYCIVGHPGEIARMFITLLSVFFMFGVNIVQYTAIPVQQAKKRRMGAIGLGLVGVILTLALYFTIMSLYLRGFFG